VTMRRHLLLLPVASLVAGILAAQTPGDPEWQTRAGGKMAFDVASVKKQPPGSFRRPLFPLDWGDSYSTTGGRFYADFPVAIYIEFAYKLALKPQQREAMLAGLPKWASGDVFEIEAKAPTSDPTKDQMRLMMQSLLADRFQLRVHFETREMPVYALILAKPGRLGPRLRPHDKGPSCDTAPPIERLEANNVPNVFPALCNILGMFPGGNGPWLAGARDVTMAYIAEALPTVNGRPLVDQTGLIGKFDFTLSYAPETSDGATAATDVPSFETALGEQLGLKLESTKTPVRTPIIDHVERPSKN
jgi:uncharacterized protein (TIGR03435 family)